MAEQFKFTNNNENNFDNSQINNKSKNLDQKLSEKIALSLLECVSSDDLQEVLNEHKELFNNPNNWIFNAKWSLAGNQQSNACSAFIELVINSMDSCLIKKAKEQAPKNLSDKKMHAYLRSKDMPQSMEKAVKRFCPQIPEGKLSGCDSKQKNKIANESIIIGVKRATRYKKYPTYTIIDFGEGQEPKDFKDTFVSVEDKANNKEGIAFVQGKFKMGSTGVFRFLTSGDIKKGHCKLIISKQSNIWAWTLVRVREAQKNEELPVVEYFSFNKNIVPCFSADSIQAFNHKGLKQKALNLLNKENIGVVRQGTIIKLYEYAMDDPNFTNNKGGLDNALNVNLMHCALPIRPYDFDSFDAGNLGELGNHNIHKRAAVSGAENYLDNNKTKLVEGFPIAIPNIVDKKLGKIDIMVHAVAIEKDGKIEGLKNFTPSTVKAFFILLTDKSMPLKMIVFLIVN